MGSKKTIISEKNILYIGPDYKFPYGGIARMLKTYSEVLYPFNFIPSMRPLLLGKENKIKTSIRFIKTLPLCFKYGFNKNIKIVHINPATGVSFIRKSFYVIFFKIFRKKIILHLHSGLFKEYYSKNKHFVNSIFKRTDFIITIAKVWEEYIRNIGYNNVTTIGNPINIPEEFEKKSNKDKVKILFLGSIDTNKGVWDLLKLAKDNKNYFNGKVKFLIAGKGETDKLMKLVNEYEITDIVEYIGWLDDTKKDVYLRNTDIYIQPSYKEGLGIAILEAMSYKIPIVATRTGGIPDIVHDNYNGYLFQPKDISLLFVKLKELIENPCLRQQMGERGYKEAQKYDISTVKHTLLNIYNNLYN